MKRIIITVLILLIYSLANADCYRNGVAYSTGEKVGGYECKDDGTWQKN